MIADPLRLEALYSIEAEMQLLGALLIQPFHLGAVMAQIEPEAFYRPAHRMIYSAMLDLHHAGTAIDQLTLEQRITDRGQMADIGGPEYLLEVALSTGSAANCEHYAKIVAGKWASRRYIALADKLKEAALTGAPASDLEAIRQSEVPVVDRRAPVVPIYAVDAEEEDRGVTTGFRELDLTITTGGYPCGQTTVVSAYHKGGKSTFMLSSAIAQADSGLKVLYATFADLNAKRLKRRALRNLCGWSNRPLRDLDAATDYAGALTRIDGAWQLWIYDAAKADTGQDVETFAAWLESEHSRRPFDAVFVDYAQRLTSRDRKATTDYAESGICSKKLARLAERTELPIVIGSQITEGSDKAGTKTKTKGSRAWEEDAGWVLRLNREDQSEKASVEVAYSRFGRMGLEVPFRWNGERLRFEAVA